MPKSIIAIDIDDVLANENESMRLFINEAYGLNLTAEDYLVEAPYWGYWESVWGVDKAEGAKRYQAYLSSGVKARHVPVDGAIAAVTQLKKKYQLVIVTARAEQLLEVTHSWLEKHFPKAFQNVAFVSLISGDQKASKAAITKQLGAQYLLDDNLQHCIDAARAGIGALLFGDYGWNRTAELPPGVTRLKDWQAVKDYFDARG